ncbi:transmembrane protein 245-like isoform X2 [Phoenix dactylifera]|uniref:Transmembrane protein 245-like isoform X2 n=1 Tax=Phoenix dactylifera TaxID=42345 RepID=A0A8B9B0W7_PHODC|nr:transmembrane protein 245-like isoform X2 [Phoenix dactylifera]
MSRRKRPPPPPPRKKKPQQQKEKEEDDDEEEVAGLGMGNSLSRDPQVCLALYIAMAHAGLALSLALLYGLTRLLRDYWRPILWALLCSMPLRELHTAIVSFWSHPLRLGLLETLLAIPLAAFRSAASSLIDSHAAVLRLLHRRAPLLPTPTAPVGFSKLMQWLVSFGLFVLLHERVGPLSLPVFAVPALLAYANGSRPPPVAATLSRIHSRRRPRPARTPVLSRLSRYLTSGLLSRLHTLVAISLIIFMIFGTLSGFLFFSYKIGIEGRDAVISIKTHLQHHNYSQWIGFQKWMDDNDVPVLIESYTSKFYESISQYIDSLALQYNATEIVDGFRLHLLKPLESSNSSAIAEQREHHHAFPKKLQIFLHRVRNQEWRLIYAESDGVFREFLAVIARDDLMEKIKAIALQSIDVSKRVFASTTMVLAGSANILFSVTLSLLSGAVELLNFVSQLTLFFWLLYYLITLESGGVMDHVLEMLPISKSTRVRCAEVLDHAVSSVLLATAKVALFQGCFTYLLFRFYRIHFLYVSTSLAWMSAVFPITPFWLSSIPAAAQLVMEARYVEAVGLTAVHLVLLDYGTCAIQDEIPGQSSYLTGLSIIGGIALFPSVLEMMLSTIKENQFSNRKEKKSGGQSWDHY